MGAMRDGAGNAPAVVVIDRAAGAVVAGPAAPSAAPLFGGSAMTVEGLISIPSRFDAAETMDRLEAAVRASGATIFARIDHAAGAAAVGAALPPTQLLVFGNPQAGTPLMQAHQTIGIDLPLRVLTWRDPAGAVWISHDDPAWLARRHGLGTAVAATTAHIAATLKALTRKAAGTPHGPDGPAINP
jgi:uncharacterized protein (DUF302 family)